MHRHHTSPRLEYRKQESLRAQSSASLAEKFQDLRTLTVELETVDPERFTTTSQIKYTVNLLHAKSVFRFGCSNNECVQGDFDLSAELAQAVAARHNSVKGEMVCQGWRNKATIDRVHCHNILRYKLSLGY